MKRKFLCSMLAALLVLAFSASAAFAEAQLYYVTDDAGILTEEEDIELEQMAESVSLEYGIGVYIITVDNYQNYGTGDVYETTYGIYHDYTLGLGDDRNGIILLLSMYERDYALFCYGDDCEYTFNSYAQEQLEDVFLDNFANDDWYGGFADYIETCADYMKQADAGEPVRESPTVPLILVSCFALFIALLIVAFIWMRMSSVAEETTANAYVSGALELTGQNDVFTHRTEVRQKIQTSSSGGSSIAHSGGGGSGRSGKF